ncbi:hypothetical protein C0995_010943, partial [Termitomyces sp. Mi166
MLKFNVLSVLLATSAFATPLKTGDAVITQQIKVMNTYFQQIRLSFVVNGVRRIGVAHNVVHGAAGGNAVEQQLKAYRQGDAKTLNIYTVGKTPYLSYAGWSSYPWDYQNSPMNDGIVIDYDTLPGGAYLGMNTGKESGQLYITFLQSFDYMVHEVGHWVGLLHTFEGGCNGGDYVDDTPAEASPASDCPVGRDTCSAPGADPI